MARAYSDDLRRKLLEAHQDGEGTLEELAKQFRLSAAWARKISAYFHCSGKMERPGKQRERKIEVEEFCKAAVAKQWV
jgi:hypothetical protein